MKEIRLDESQGDMYRQAIESSPGFPDRIYLEQQRRLALSSENDTLRSEARKTLARIAFTYGSRDVAELILMEIERAG